MLESVFSGLFDGSTAAAIPVSSFLLCVACSLVLGLLLAAAYGLRSRSSGSFIATVAMLPAVVCVVIMMVNGNIGAGVAVAGVFGLVRFRSVPGTAKEIGIIFLAMGAGLIAGMGYLGYAALFTLIMCAVMLLYSRFDLGAGKNSARARTMRITIPEDLDYTDVFTDVFRQYTTDCELTQVKTTNMGSLFRLTYDLTLRDPALEKELIDKLRTRNGNLEITVSRQAASHEL